MIGTKLAHYEITGHLGTGGMGEVWKARDFNLGREVAIKTLPPEFAANTGHLSRFRREARAASALNHPNICIVYELGEHDGQPFIVMELLRGETLRERLERGPLPIDEALDLGMQLADGLDAAHCEGIIHRDIKPANIFITNRGPAKLLDFGLARAQSAAPEDAPTLGVTSAGTVMGTVSYMSPEQARGEKLDVRSDLFSLGVVFYEMLSGQPAFTGNTSAVVFERLFNKVLEPLTRLNSGIPKDLDTLVEGLLAKDRNRRSSSAREVKTALGRLKSGLASRPTVASNSEKKSIAVLPLENLSADANNEYFSDGLTEEIITDLSQIRSLRVISRNSSMQFKGSGKNLRTISADLDVRYLLTGSVRKSGNAVRVAVQLIDPLGDEHLWSEKYSGKLEDIFEIQEQISRKIVDALRLRLSPQEEQKLAARPIDNVKAFECYHRARREIYKFTEDGLDRALQLIQTALDMVGDNELLYAAQGTVHWQYFNSGLRPDKAEIDRAEECARRVFKINPDSAAGHALMGQVRHAQRRFAEAVRSFKRALTADPSNHYAAVELARIYSFAGYESGLESLNEQALAVDPLSAVAHMARLAAALLFGHSDVARREGAGLVQTMPDFPMLRLSYMISLVYAEQTGAALNILEVMPCQGASNLAGHLCMAWKLALRSERTRAIEYLNGPSMAPARNYEWGSWWAAECCAFIGEVDMALDWLDNSLECGNFNYPYFSKHGHLLRKLDGNPRFQKLLSKVKTAWEEFEP